MVCEHRHLRPHHGYYYVTQTQNRVQLRFERQHHSNGGVYVSIRHSSSQALDHASKPGGQEEADGPE